MAQRDLDEMCEDSWRWQLKNPAWDIFGYNLDCIPICNFKESF